MPFWPPACGCSLVVPSASYLWDWGGMLRPGKGSPGWPIWKLPA